MNANVKQVIMERTPDGQLPKVFAELEQEQKQTNDEAETGIPAAGADPIPAGGQDASADWAAYDSVHIDTSMYFASQPGGQIAVPTSGNQVIEDSSVSSTIVHAAKKQRLHGAPQ